MTDYWKPAEADFVAAYGELYEHSAWIASDAWHEINAANQAQPSASQQLSQDALLSVLEKTVSNAGREKQLALICAHPDLAGRASVAGELTGHSTEEQSSARLDQCTAEELARFQSLNDRYKDQFGFPFIMAVRNRTRTEILDAFAERINNTEANEFNLALENIHQIARLRLEAMSVS